MKCPKCHYVSFEPEPRCRNCGYGFSLADADPAPAAADLALDRRAEADAGRAPVAAPAPAPSPALVRPAAAPAAAIAQRPAVSPSPEPVAGGPFASAALAAWEPELVKTSAPPPNTELPLFVKPRVTDHRAEPAPFSALDEPLVRVPAEPRPPLAVRRPLPESPAAPRPAARQAPRRLGPLDRDLLEDLERIERAERSAPRGYEQTHAGAGVEETLTSIGGGRRLAAAAIDALVIGGVSAGVLWLTLRWLELPFEQLAIVPALPMIAFLALVGLGYLLVFTAAGGQTIGKMVCGLRVIGESDEEGTESPAPLTVSQASWRVLLSLASVLALGLGLLPAVLGRDEAIHDRLAHTRVVRA